MRLPTVTILLWLVGPACTGGASSGDGNGGPNNGNGAGNDNDTLGSGPVLGRGAPVPYFEYEAEAAQSQGTVLQPSRAFGSVASESSGRSAMQLNASGDYVAFILQHAANSIVVRYAVPDAGANTLGVYVGSVRHTLQVTSRYAWTYGDADAQGQNSEASSAGTAHHFYDEAHLMFDAAPAGTVVKIQRDAQDTASFYTIDLVDFEDVPAAGVKPTGALSITDYGAVANDGADDSAAIQATINAAIDQNAEVWIPAGTFDTQANTNNGATTYKLHAAGVTVRGAGMWYSTIQGFGAQFEVSQNSSGQYVTSNRPTQFLDFALFGDVTYRDDSKGWQGFDGPWGTGGLLQNVWIEHQTAGIWVGHGTAPTPVNTPLTTGLTVDGVRVRNTYADGINLNDATADSHVVNSTFRNNGDDAIATWSYASDGTTPCARNDFGHNTVQMPWRANCFAAYGGQDSNFHDSVCTDTTNYPGMMLSASSSFNALPLSGNTYATNITLLRAGGAHYNQPWGALYLQAASGAAPGLQVSNMDVLSPSYYGVELTTSGQQQIQAAVLDAINISGWQAAGDLHQMATADPLSAIWVTSGSSGSATLSAVVLSAPLANDIAFQNDAASSFTVTMGQGNSGF